ncbi:GNAT family N-acetyltransferase [Mobilicoccus massiliensis]|uniref:GNAT family N-acetyltransferase n=1 Tax=Mobilicoccus massiliensis TaxID=1522310 RepID=UPI000694CCDF|nr:GNAT family N-acetyltransferase [Mobilicoccus massiliensis]
MLIDLRSRAELRALTGPGDAFARLDPSEELRGWGQADGTVAVIRASSFRPPSLFVWGPDVAGLLDALIDEDVVGRFELAGVSVPYPARDEVTARFAVAGGGDWDWMWTDRPTPRAPGSHVPLVALDDTRDAAEIAALGAENPRFEGVPGQGYNDRWLGVRDADGTLVACGAVQRLPAGTAHLGGILVASDHRRRGLGTAISAALTDDIVRAEGVCTLGMYSDNDAARALYTRLGYTTDKSWASRRLA